jgi:hypothetical protein
MKSTAENTKSVFSYPVERIRRPSFAMCATIRSMRRCSTGMVPKGAIKAFFGDPRFPFDTHSEICG